MLIDNKIAVARQLVMKCGLKRQEPEHDLTQGGRDPLVNGPMGIQCSMTLLIANRPQLDT